MEKEKKKNIRYKILLFLGIICIILFIAKVIVEKYFINDIRIVNQINQNFPISVSTKDALFIKTYSIAKYQALIESGNYEAAYDMLTEEYKNYKDYEDYLNDIKSIDFSTLKLKEVRRMGEYLYIAPVEYIKNGEKEDTIYLVVVSPLNSKKMFISPDKFLYTAEKIKSFKEDNIKITVESLVVGTENIDMKLKIENRNSNELEIQAIGLGINQQQTTKQKYDNLKIAPKSEKIIDVTLESNYVVPISLKIERILDEKTLRTYTFDIR